MKVLVVFGSERGGTAGLAHMIAESFSRHGLSVEVRDAASPGQIHADVVVLGGALYMNRWHKAARKFARAHEPALRRLPVWLFSSGPLDTTARAGDIAPTDQVKSIARRIEARGHMTFGGRLEPEAKGFIAGRMAKTMAGDWRDRQHVEEWVQDILHELPTVHVDLVAAEGRRVAVPSQRISPEILSPIGSE